MSDVSSSSNSSSASPSPKKAPPPTPPPPSSVRGSDADGSSGSAGSSDSVNDADVAKKRQRSHHTRKKEERPRSGTKKSKKKPNKLSKPAKPDAVEVDSGSSNDSSRSDTAAGTSAKPKSTDNNDDNDDNAPNAAPDASGSVSESSRSSSDESNDNADDKGTRAPDAPEDAPPVAHSSANDDYPEDDERKPVVGTAAADASGSSSRDGSDNDDGTTTGVAAKSKRRARASSSTSKRPSNKRYFFKRTRKFFHTARDKLRSVKNRVKREFDLDGGDIDVSSETLDKLNERKDVVKLLHRAIRAKHKRKTAKLVTYLRTQRDGLHADDLKDARQAQTLLKLLLGLSQESDTKQKTKKTKKTSTSTQRFSFDNVHVTLLAMRAMGVDVDRCVSVPKTSTHRSGSLFRKRQCTVPFALAAMTHPSTDQRTAWLTKLHADNNTLRFAWNRDVTPSVGSGNLLVASYAVLRIPDVAWYEMLVNTLGCDVNNRRNSRTLLDYVQRDEREGSGVGDAAFRNALVDLVTAKGGKTSAQLRQGGG